VSGLKILPKPTVAGEPLLFEFDCHCCKYLVANYTDGVIYANMDNKVDKITGFRILPGCAYVMVKNENLTQKGIPRMEPYSKVVSVLPTATSEDGVTVQALNYFQGV